ncbi:MAG TPA: glycine--tRNA ligase subunit beta [Kofleriaceae bacterium]|nr:glycine--tRNA ligase subunit beta [Kofleriaceae bacterium]
MGADLLVELGCEEIPAGFLAEAVDWLEGVFPERLAQARLAVASRDVKVFGTPRRLVLTAAGIPERQPDLAEKVVGPPARVAFDKEGQATRAALGFAAKNGVEVSALGREEVEGKQGEYAVCTRREAGRSARDVLPALLVQLFADIPWKKSMRWGDGRHRFVRPVHWLVALWGGEVLALEVFGVRAGRETFGHRFLAPEAIALDGSISGYVAALEKAHVIADPSRRRERVRSELSRIEGELSGRVRADEPLINEVANLCEEPTAVWGAFSPAFLEVPAAVVISAMRAHQRYFAVEDESGQLLPKFVTIAGTQVCDASVVRAGNERVLAARLADAQFFFREDQKQPLAAWAEKLAGVVFQKKLGTIADKVERMVKVAEKLASAAGADAAMCVRAAKLCKADLVTHMVGEFPELQGVIGRRYAELSGEKAEVASAIEEHYQPRGAGDRLPHSDVGAVVAIADRMDTLVGGFAVGLAPSGSADPYGLRRAALGILAILLDRSLPVPLSSLGEWARDSLSKIDVTDAHMEAVREFISARLRGVLIEGNDLPADCVDAALAAGADDVPDVRARAEALADLRKQPDFEPLAIAFKRVANILKGEAPATEGPYPDRFVEAGETALWNAFTAIEAKVDALLDARDYGAALAKLAELRAPVDQFFDAVLVMDKDEKVRENRLALLSRINRTFTRIADFRQLAVTA